MKQQSNQSEFTLQCQSIILGLLMPRVPANSNRVCKKKKKKKAVATMNDKPKGMKKCPTELKDYIYNLAGPLTKYLNGRMELISELNKRLIRRDAILMQWKGD